MVIFIVGKTTIAHKYYPGNWFKLIPLKCYSSLLHEASCTELSTEEVNGNETVLLIPDRWNELRQ